MSEDTRTSPLFDDYRAWERANPSLTLGRTLTANLASWQQYLWENREAIWDKRAKDDTTPRIHPLWFDHPPLTYYEIYILLKAGIFKVLPNHSDLFAGPNWKSPLHAMNHILNHYRARQREHE